MCNICIAPLKVSYSEVTIFVGLNTDMLLQGHLHRFV